MDLIKFTNLRSWLYHLTDRRNLNYIIEKKILYSTKKLIELSKNGDYSDFISKKRNNHNIILMEDNEVRIRDQRPISEKALSKCLTDNWSCSDYYKYLNSRVFFWSTIDRLCRHFSRYQEEKPIILRIKTEDLFLLNQNAQFSSINSGATRANSYLGGIAPQRGQNTFLSASDFDQSPAKVAEVVFKNSCLLPDVIYKGNNPCGPWNKIQI